MATFMFAPIPLQRQRVVYSHSMATLALCEAYGMTQDEAVRSAAQRAIDFLVESQDPWVVVGDTHRELDQIPA